MHLVSIASRPLSPRERDALHYLLAFDPPPEVADAHGAFVSQIEFARVTGRCDCGCATVDLSVDPERASRAIGRAEESPYSEANHLTEQRDLILFVRDGWLSSIEIVDYDEVHAPELPDPVRFGLPHLAT